MEDIVFIGDWIKDSLLGSGSFGIVALWKHKRTDERLAIKVCKWDKELSDKHRERWTQEVKMLQSFKNPNIVNTKEMPAEFIKGLAHANLSNLPILCMEYCSGGDLRQLLNRPTSCSGLKEIQVRQILKDIANAVQFLHSNKITHRDLKPENIVMQIIDNEDVDETPRKQRKVLYKLIDLGYAKEIDTKSVCASFVGTLQYLAPEIFYSKTYSNSVDYWSLGLLAFEIISGVRPFLPNMAPVLWMQHVKQKSPENICVYETYHGDIEFSNELFAENHISKKLKILMEKWLKLALEWDPKLRGRDAPSKVTFNLPTEQKQNSSKVVLFDVLFETLNKKIIKIFSFPSMTQLEYEIENSHNISLLKQWIFKDTKIPVGDQILISKAKYNTIQDEELISNYWNDSNEVTLYLYSKTVFMNENVEPVVPKAVQRSLEHPKALYNYNNSQTLYRNGFFFVTLQMEIYDQVIYGIFVRTESLKEENRQLFLKYNTVDKEIAILLAKHDILKNIFETGKKHIEHFKENGTGLGHFISFEKAFSEWDIVTDKIAKVQNAWAYVNTRLQSAEKRSKEVTPEEINNFAAKYNYKNIYIASHEAYMLYRKNEHDFRVKERQCHDIMKICYDCLKQRSKIYNEVQHQPFVLKLMNLSSEFAKINDIVKTAAENTEKIMKQLSDLSVEVTDNLWTTVSILSAAENLADIPYSVISFEKKDFKIGGPVTNNYQKTPSSNSDNVFKTLIEESMKLRKSQSQFTEEIKSHKKEFENSLLDFSFLNEV